MGVSRSKDSAVAFEAIIRRFKSDYARMGSWGSNPDTPAVQICESWEGRV